MGRRGKEEVPQEKQATGHKEGREVLGGGQERLGNEYADDYEASSSPLCLGRGRTARPRCVTPRQNELVVAYGEMKVYDHSAGTLILVHREQQKTAAAPRVDPTSGLA